MVYDESLDNYNSSRDQLTLAETSVTRHRYNQAWKEVKRLYIEIINTSDDDNARVHWQARLDS